MGRCTPVLPEWHCEIGFPAFGLQLGQPPDHCGPPSNAYEAPPGALRCSRQPCALPWAVPRPEQAEPLVKNTPLTHNSLWALPQALLPWWQAAAGVGSGVGSRLFSSAASAAEALAQAPPAFVFDIDGVLVRGRRVLPEAKR